MHQLQFLHEGVPYQRFIDGNHNVRTQISYSTNLLSHEEAHLSVGLHPVTFNVAGGGLIERLNGADFQDLQGAIHHVH